MYEKCSILVVNKIDAMPVFDFDTERLERDVRSLNPEMKIFYISAKTGEGVEPLAAELIRQVKEWNA
jgi:hydrogenase nickel incorporation protein HypB